MTEQAIAVPAFEQAEVQERMRMARKRRTISHQPVSEFVEELKKAQAKAKDFLVPYRNLRVAVQAEETIDGEGVSDSYKLVLCLHDIIIDGKKHDRIDVPFYEHVLGHISTHTGVDTAGVPIAYLRRLLANSADRAFVSLAAANVNEWLSRRSGEMHTKGAKGVKCVLVRTFLEDDGRYYCRAIVSDRYFPLRTLDMVTIALGVVLGKTGDADIDKTAAKNAWMFDQRISVEEVNVGFVNPRYAFDLRLKIGDDEMSMYESVLTQLSGLTNIGDRAGVPSAYIKRLLANNGDEQFVNLAAVNVNEFLVRRSGEKHTRGKKVEKGVFVRSLKDETGKPIIRALLSDRYFVLNNLDIVLTALAIVTKTNDGGTAAKNARAFDWHLDPFRMELGFVNPGIAFDLRHPEKGLIRCEAKKDDHGWVYPGGGAFDIGKGWTGARGEGDKSEHLVFPACFISNSETGGGSANIEMSFMEAVCLNTAGMGQSITRRHLGGRSA